MSRRTNDEGRPSLRIEVATATERLGAEIAGHNGLTPEEGREEAARAVRFFSALLDLPLPCHGTSSKAEPLDAPNAA